MEKIIHSEMYMRLKFDHTTIPESFKENEKHKILWDSEIQRDHLILVRRLNLEIIDAEKKNLSICAFWRSGGLQSKNKKKTKW